MLQNSFYAILGTFYTLLNNTDLYLSYFILSYVFLGHNDSVEWGLTVSGKGKTNLSIPKIYSIFLYLCKVSERLDNIYTVRPHSTLSVCPRKT
mgnify:CR=1 FL=1